MAENGKSLQEIVLIKNHKLWASSWSFIMDVNSFWVHNKVIEMQTRPFIMNTLRSTHSPIPKCFNLNKNSN